jgi:hypothetical protein
LPMRIAQRFGILYKRVLGTSLRRLDPAGLQ